MLALQKPHSRSVRQAHQHWERGVALGKRGDWGDALKAFEAALKQSPNDDVYLLNAAKAAHKVGQFEDSVRYSGKALKQNPASELALMLKVGALNRLQRHGDIIELLKSVKEEARHDHDYWSAMACALQNSGQHQQAIPIFMNTLQEQMDDALSHYRMGISFYELLLKEEASECFRTGLLLGLGAYELHVHGMLAYAERESCRWTHAREAEQKMKALVEAAADNAAIMTAPFAHITLVDDPLHQLKACRLMSNNWRGIKPAVRHARPRTEGRIRLGYLSADFHQHATCVLMCEVFEQTDRSQFEVFLYSHGSNIERTAMRLRVEQSAEHFVNLRGVPDQDIAQRIADDQIDLLIDLKGFTAENRMSVMARRPAPVQATFLGFPGTTGGDYMDYIIGDPIVTPIEHATHFAEQIAQMPICYQPNDQQRIRPSPMTRAEAGLSEDAVVLCGFNQAYKISDEVLDVWCGLLNDIPNAVLWLLDWHGQARPHLEEELSVRGVDLSRIHWAPRLGLTEHINRIRLADVFIDTWPCNAHTTASDALWSGLPVVTYRGKTFASRVASSLLNAVGLPELIADSLAEYHDKVVQLASDPQAIQRLKDHLDRARDTAPLFDSAAYTRDFNALLKRMVERHQQGLEPAPLLAQR